MGMRGFLDFGNAPEFPFLLLARDRVESLLDEVGYGTSVDLA